MSDVEPSIDRSLRILIVDDEPFIRKIVVRLLRDLGCLDLHEADDGARALQQCRTYGPGLIICDINMKPVNGLEFIRAVRQGKAGVPRGTPVIMLTGVSDENTVGSALALDVNAFLVKPVSRAQLESKLLRSVSTPVEVRDKSDYAEIALPKSDQPLDTGDSDDPPKSLSGAAKRALPVAGSEKPAPSADKGKSPKYSTQVVKKSPEDMRAMGATLRKLSELAPKSRLAENIVSPNGVLIVAEGDVLSQAMIDKLDDIQIMFGKTEIWVIEPT